jgi:hypothetical protein
VVNVTGADRRRLKAIISDRSAPQKRRHLSRRRAPTTRYPGSPDPFDAEVLAEIGPPSAIAQNEFSARLRPPCAEASGCPDPCIAPRPAPAGGGRTSVK